MPQGNQGFDTDSDSGLTAAGVAFKIAPARRCRGCRNRFRISGYQLAVARGSFCPRWPKPSTCAGITVPISSVPLTGISNRRDFLQRLQSRWDESTAKNKPLTIIMLDVDHFKKVNDTWGHGAGDEILKEVARRGRSVLRGEDLFARYGGEEFIVAVPNASVGAALATAERVRAEIASRPVVIAEGEVRVTCSLGVATRDTETEISALIDRADRALYRSKEGGRNRVSQG